MQHQGSNQGLLKGFIHQCTDQASALATEAGILQPSPHVLMGADDERSDHQDPLPVLYDALTTLEGKHAEITRVRRVKDTLLFFPSKRGTSSLKSREWTHVREGYSVNPWGWLLLPVVPVLNMSTWVQVHVPLNTNTGLYQYICTIRWRPRLNILLTQTSEGGNTGKTLT